MLINQYTQYTAASGTLYEIKDCMTYVKSDKYVQHCTVYSKSASELNVKMCAKNYEIIILNMTFTKYNNGILNKNIPTTVY